MLVLPRGELQERVHMRVTDSYSSRMYLREVFYWLWDNVRERCSAASCRAQKRYVGFYRGERPIFAYIDLQQHGLKIGVKENGFDGIALRSLKRGHFPEWGGTPLVGFTLSTQNLDIVDVLEACYRRA